MRFELMRITMRVATGAVLALSLAACGDSTTESAELQAEQVTAAQAPSVHVTPVEPRKLQAWVYSQGTARSRQREFLTFTQQGIVSYVDETLRVGSTVKAGQLIAHQAPERVNADLKAAQASLAEAEAGLRLARVTRQRYVTLIKQRSASQQELDEATVQEQQAKAARDNAQAQLAQAKLTVAESRLVSPIDGLLARLNVEKGRYFMPATLQTDTEQRALRTVPALVIDPNRSEIRVDLPSYDFRDIEVTAQAIIGGGTPGAGNDLDPLASDQHTKGTVYAISPSLDPETRTFEVIIHTEGENTVLQDGEFVAVWIALSAQPNVLSIPLEALRFRNDQAFVFVADAKSNKVAERRVELGQQAGDFRAVLQGVKEGELVVTDGRAALYDGQTIRILAQAELAQ